MAPKIAAPRGTQDIVPPNTVAWQRLEAKIRALTYRYGYGEIRTPIFEATELFVRSVGDDTDIVGKEMYTFTDKGGRSMTLRPEWTAPVMRAALANNLLDRGPQRLYYIGPIFRHERPQAGRYRQSHQFGVECTGFFGAEADVEVISLAWELLESYQLREVQLHVNSIGDEHCRPRYRQALLEYFRPRLGELSEEAQRRLERNPLRLLDSKDPEDRRIAHSAPRAHEMLCDLCREHFDAVKRYLDALQIPYVVDPMIVRGLDYYTRTVFEFESPVLGAQNTVCAGGRYDDLIASLGGARIPAVGFALGLERFLLAAGAEGPEEPISRAGVQAIALGPEARERAVPIVAQLRRRLRGPVFIDYADRKIAAQLRIADRNAAAYALILGSRELEAGYVVLRDLAARSERRVALADAEAALVEVGA